MLYSNIVQRNLDLIRPLLFAIEAAPTADRMLDLAIPGYTSAEIAYHVWLLHQHGLIVAIDCSNMQGGMCWKATALTWDGHEFLDAVRNDTFWYKLKSFVLEKTGTLTVEGLKVAAPLLIKSLLGL